MNTSISSVLAVGLGLGLMACASAEPSDTAGDESNVTGLTPPPEKKISGYDFDGAKVTTKNLILCAFHVQPEESVRCGDISGASTQGVDCQILCNKPIAKRGSAAGYDLTGFKTLPNDKVPVELCAEVISADEIACRAANGELSSANGCKKLCSVPIAPEGKIAGYNGTTFKIVAALESNAEVMCNSKDDETKCAEVGGKHQLGVGCVSICSLPY